MTETLNILLWIGAITWAVFALQALINAVLIPNLARRRDPEPEHWPRVSYVVPARNEETGIRQAVQSFCTQDYPNLEVIVVNDRSTDRTAEILDELQREHPMLQVVEGQDPPPGWLGKPNALTLGHRQATGDWILMADADALHAPELLRRAMALGLLRDDVGMVTVRPRHVTRGFWEAVLMSGVNFFFFVVSPLFLVRLARSALFATGSPVFNLVRRDALEACGGFGCLKSAVVDDLEIGFCVKRAGYRLDVAFSGALVGHRMYGGAAETVRGFGKTTFPTIKKVPWLLPLYVAFGLTVSVLPYVAAGAGLLADGVAVPAMISLALMHAVMAGLAWRYAEPWYVALTNPLRELAWLWIFVRSCVLYYRKGLEWRGRSYPASS